jgi:hypothetical protein
VIRASVDVVKLDPADQRVTKSPSANSAARLACISYILYILYTRDALAKLHSACVK